MMAEWFTGVEVQAGKVWDGAVSVSLGAGLTDWARTSLELSLL
jgi:hypothetical protein